MGSASVLRRARGGKIWQRKILIFVFSLPNRRGVVTRRQKQVLDFVHGYLRRHGYAPSLEEIARHLRLASLATVHKHLTRLESRGLIRRRAHQSRSLEVLDRPGAQAAATVPLLGRVAAGRPVEPVETAETVSLPEDFLGRGDTFALRVVGDSMIGDGILDGDVVVVEARPDAANGATVVAVVRGEATVKRFYRRRGRVHLIPANERVEPIVAHPADVQLRGVVIGLLRRYR
jgi:repressor LexA